MRDAKNAAKVATFSLFVFFKNVVNAGATWRNE
jgi:hypothetical protein